MLRILCDKCNGNRVIIVPVKKQPGKVLGKTIECPNCKGKGYTEHDGSLEDLECAEIERELFEKFNGVEILFIKGVDACHIRLNIFVDENHRATQFFGLTKLEALCKAKEWMNGGK